jgi:hypothetical protein
VSVGKGHGSRAWLNDTVVYSVYNGKIKISCKSGIIAMALGF